MIAGRNPRLGRQLFTFSGMFQTLSLGLLLQFAPILAILESFIYVAGIPVIRAVQINRTFVLGTGSDGFTMIELMIVLVLIGFLALVAVPSYNSLVQKGKVAGAVADLAKIGQQAIRFQLNNGVLPNSLSEMADIPLTDPWGYNYRYVNIATVQGKGGLRKDRNLVPINTLFDLYSVGEDGASVSPLTAKPSRDDVVWANDGQFIGLAVDY